MTRRHKEFVESRPLPLQAGAGTTCGTMRCLPLPPCIFLAAVQSSIPPALPSPQCLVRVGRGEGEGCY